MSSTGHSKARLFIGSSSEGIAVARAVQAHLDSVAEVTVWQDGPFKQNDGNLEALLKMLDYYDFAVFVFTPDDLVESRGTKSPCPRDNVLFEFGLFLGALSKSRCFALASDDRNLKLPSDFHGVTFGRYDPRRSDGNFIAATATACSLYKDEISKLKPRHREVVASDEFEASQANKESRHISDLASEAQERWGIELSPNSAWGRIRNPITAWFHSERFTKAFPGVRGIASVDKPAEAIARLAMLLEAPLAWVYEEQEMLMTTNPVWWWRGHSNNAIDDFRSPGENIVLLDRKELAIRRVVAVNAGSYWQSFVYVECDALPPIGLYQQDPEVISAEVSRSGYDCEEYAIFDGHAITRAEYDDGAAIINGKPVRTSGADLRVRYITPYNFLISSQKSPINNHKFDLTAACILDGILKGHRSIDDLVNAVLTLPRKDEFD